ncbi:MAG: 3-phosphoshikimate 1-carboxyvinyltransferase [Lachnospiraceae bacterium]
MNITVNRSTALGEIKAPPSKSMAHRCLICAALAEGKSVLSGFAFSQDILATLDCIQSLGAGVQIEKDQITVTGAGNLADRKKAQFPCRESGSTLRFFLPLAMLSPDPAVFFGSERLLERPLGIYEEICEKQKIIFKKEPGEILVQGTLSSGSYEVPGNISSQFITGLLFTLPLLTGDSEIWIKQPIESLSYIKMTVAAMQEFGIRLNWEKDEHLVIPGNQRYQSRNMQIEGDYSNAAFLEAFNTIGGNVKVSGLSHKTLQGDAVYQSLFRKLMQEEQTIDLSDCPDLGPILFVVAALCHGGHFTGTGRLAIKESDRGRVMCKELGKAGVETIYRENEIIIRKSDLFSPKEPLKGHNDHRIVMALTVLLTKTGGRLEGAEAVAKSYPDFFREIQKLGIEVQEDGVVS